MLLMFRLGRKPQYARDAVCRKALGRSAPYGGYKTSPLIGLCDILVNCSDVMIRLGDIGIEMDINYTPL